MRRVLVLSCSRRKRADSELLPAIERYDGPSFGIVRRYLRERQDGDLSIFILSAKFGLISSSERIPWYDQRMTRERARELRPLVTSTLRCELASSSDACARRHDILLHLGRTYLGVFDDLLLPETGTQPTETAGSYGQRLSQLHDWLFGSPPKHVIQADTTARSRLRLRGVEVTLSGDELLDRARAALKANPEEARSFRSWCVVIDGQPVAPKWLVSLMTGLPVSQFSTTDALKLLAQLGIEARRP